MRVEKNPVAKLCIIGKVMAHSICKRSWGVRLIQSFKEAEWDGLIIPGATANDSRLRIWLGEPAPFLADFIARYWYLEGDFEATPTMAIAPPLPFSAWGVMQRSNEGGSPAGSVRNHEFLLHPCMRTNCFPVRGKFRQIGFHFNFGGFAALGGNMSATNLKDALDSNRENFSPLPLLPWDLSVAADFFDCVESWLSGVVQFADKRHLLTVRRLVRFFLEEPETASIADAASRLGVSERCLQRTCKSATGLSPCQVRRLVRIQKAIKSMRRGGAGTSANVALETGFFDQAHMLHEFRKLLGELPDKFSQYW
jgi:AraC-like DNA-binding protein